MLFNLILIFFKFFKFQIRDPSHSFFLFFLIFLIFFGFRIFPDSEMSERGKISVKAEMTAAPLNLSSDNADDKKPKRDNETAANNGEVDRAKRVKSEQTEATDLSMKSTGSVTQVIPFSNH